VIKLPGFRANRDVECDQDVGMLVSSAGDSLSVEVELEWFPHGLESVLNAAEFERVEEHASAQQCGPTQEMSLESCLQHFTTTEVLSDNDRWYCSKCKEHTRATKTMQLWSAPDYLIIHLKRFSDQDGVSLFSREKIDTLVKFPLEGLDLAPFVDSCRSASRPGSRQESAAIVPMLYDLYAVSNHFGGVGFGHYTSFCKSPADGKWRVFDDSSVSIVNFDSICTPAAYVLFYSLRQ
jgi:ubiquitin carboxyl-terminal hydrolase 4/11/15